MKLQLNVREVEAILVAIDSFSDAVEQSGIFRSAFIKDVKVLEIVEKRIRKMTLKAALVSYKEPK